MGLRAGSALIQHYRTVHACPPRSCSLWRRAFTIMGARVIIRTDLLVSPTPADDRGGFLVSAPRAAVNEECGYRLAWNGVRYRTKFGRHGRPASRSDFPPWWRRRCMRWAGSRKSVIDGSRLHRRQNLVGRTGRAFVQAGGGATFIVWRGLVFRAGGGFAEGGSRMGALPGLEYVPWSGGSSAPRGFAGFAIPKRNRMHVAWQCTGSAAMSALFVAA